MSVRYASRRFFLVQVPVQIGTLFLFSAFSISAVAQLSADGTSTPPPSAVQVQPSPGARNSLSTPPKEGFWGETVFFARKKWVDRKLDPVNGQLKQLDEVKAENAQDTQLLEVESHAPGADNNGVETSSKLAEAVKRYLVTEHDLPIHRMHSVALGNLPGSDAAKTVRTS